MLSASSRARCDSLDMNGRLPRLDAGAILYFPGRYVLILGLILERGRRREGRHRRAVPDEVDSRQFVVGAREGELQPVDELVQPGLVERFETGAMQGPAHARHAPQQRFAVPQTVQDLLRTPQAAHA